MQRLRCQPRRRVENVCQVISTGVGFRALPPAKAKLSNELIAYLEHSNREINSKNGKCATSVEEKIIYRLPWHLQGRAKNLQWTGRGEGGEGLQRRRGRKADNFVRFGNGAVAKGTRASFRTTPHSTTLLTFSTSPYSISP
jgi:hypothetical protein